MTLRPLFCAARAVALHMTPALLLLAPGGCSSDAGPAATDAARPFTDAGGSSPDGGSPAGDGSPADRSSPADRAAPADVGSSADASPPDGGSPPDRGSPADVGAPAGDARNDAGTPVAGVVAAGVRWFGRVDTITDPAQPRFSWSGTGFLARFSGTSLSAQLNSGGPLTFKAVIDGVPQPAFNAAAGTASYALATGLPPGVHQVELYRQTEGPQGNARLVALSVGGGALMDPPPGPQRLIEVVGDSISCGFGILGAIADVDCIPTESHWDAYPSVLARALGAEVSTIAASGRGIIRNYPGDTVDTMPMIYGRALANTATPAWDFRVQPQAVIINLGTNDISNNKGDPGAPFRDTYLALVQTIRSHYPNAYIVCIIAPLLSSAEAAAIQVHIRSVVDARRAAGDDRIELFDQIPPQTADKFACAYHPNVAENAIMANLLAGELRAKLGW